jgi:hypothetical protein
MTPIRKQIFRESSTHIRECGRSRAVIVGILPGDVLGFRLKGTRRQYVLPIGALFYQAARLYGEEMKRQKAAARKARRGG